MIADHLEFVWAAYAVAAVVLVGLIARIWIDMRRQRALLADLEARGVPRRGPATAPVAPAGAVDGERSVEA